MFIFNNRNRNFTGKICVVTVPLITNCLVDEIKGVDIGGGGGGVGLRCSCIGAELCVQKFCGET